MGEGKTNFVKSEKKKGGRKLHDAMFALKKL